jgi:hypothetical protein
VVKLENGELNIEELTILEGLTRAIHERSIILKYKSFEKKVNSDANFASRDLEASEPVSEDLKEQLTEEPTIEFSIFSGDEKVKQEADVNENKSEEVTKSSMEELTEPIIVELEKETAELNKGSSFLDSLQSIDNSVNARFNDSKLETLIGAFSLNQKLRYINELFDGSSESFSDAIKSLDEKATMDDAKEIISSLASQNEWDTEEESVIEFMAFLNRRYA